MVLQPPLIRSDRRRCVLATVEDARRQLAAWSATEDSVLQLIDEGFLPFAWHIELSIGAAREWRILPECIHHFDATGGSRHFPWTAKQATARLLEGMPKENLTSTDLRLLLNCSPAHITNLIDAGALKALPLTNPAIQKSNNPVFYRRGPAGAAVIPRESFLAFMRHRLEGGSML